MGFVIYLFILLMVMLYLPPIFALLMLIAPIVIFFLMARPSAEEKRKWDNERELIRLIDNWIDKNGGFKEVSAAASSEIDRLEMITNDSRVTSFSFQSKGYKKANRKGVESIFRHLKYKYKAVACNSERDGSAFSGSYSVSSSGNVSPNYSGGKTITKYCLRSKELLE